MHMVRLSRSCTLEQYQTYVTSRNISAICDFVVERFEERYLNPVVGSPQHKNGFAIMAISCLMIEALESFRLGWRDSRRKSSSAFRSFFSHWTVFSAFQPVAGEFYTHVRCGILHQAETTGGWLILRSGPLFVERTINAAKFASHLRHVLREYAALLRKSEWDSETWKAFRSKMDSVCSNSIVT